METGGRLDRMMEQNGPRGQSGGKWGRAMTSPPASSSTSARSTSAPFSRRKGRLKDWGLDAIECDYPKYSQSQRAFYLHLAERYGLQTRPLSVELPCEKGPLPVLSQNRKGCDRVIQSEGVEI